MKTLITRDNKSKIRTVQIDYQFDEPNQQYIISRKTSQHGGKITQQPDIVVTKGKAKRTIEEQATLEYNSIIKKYLDKGYKDISDFGFNSLDEFDPNEVLPEEVTDSNNARKPMLAKIYDEVAISVFEKKFYASRKLDGVRLMIRYESGELKTSSRGGGNYDVAAQHIIEDEKLISFMKEHQDIILDGELYIHGQPLQYISGLCRKITRESAHDDLKFYIYDVAGTNLVFEKRLEFINDNLNLNIPSIVICEHVETTSWSKIKYLHDSWVADGYEGVVIRDPNKEYGYGRKDNRMIKIKEFEDDTFNILGYELGLRGVEDMCFILETKDKKKFKAKPIGDRQTKENYFKNMNQIIGKGGDVKYFGLTSDGIPNLPTFRCVRYDLE